jgi:hypothetical protein
MGSEHSPMFTQRGLRWLLIRKGGPAASIYHRGWFNFSIAD